MPNRENRDRRTSMVLLAVVVFICMTSGHLICASTYISHIEPPKSPVYADIYTDVLHVPMDVLGLLWDFLNFCDDHCTHRHNLQTLGQCLATHMHPWELFSCEQYHVSFVDFCQYLLSQWSGNNHLWPTQNATTLGTQLETSIQTWLEFLGDLSQFWSFVFHQFNDLLENMVFCCFRTSSAEI